MNVLLAGEFTGIVREAFRRRGHNAWSCDLEPAEDGSPYHLQGDVRGYLHGAYVTQPPRWIVWDLLIAFLPCTYFANSSVQWLTRTPTHPKLGILYGAPRRAAMVEAAELWQTVAKAPIKRKAFENPIPHKYALALIGPYTQIIHPHQFGHGEMKATCLWLENLPKLVPTNNVPGREQRIWRMTPGPNRGKDRSRTFPGIAEAMAEQWGVSQA